MTSTGNDIVSLNAINAARTNQYKFYSKILSDSEKPLYNEFNLAGIPFENFVWLLWSIKESAYKFLQRHEPGLIFTPVKFVVEKLQLPVNYPVNHFEIINEGCGFNEQAVIKGSITFGSYTLYSHSLICKELLVSMVNDHDNFENICWGVKKIDNPDQENQSKEARLFLLDKLRSIYGDANFAIGKNPSGCPVLLSDETTMAIPVSLSHHENFVGYSFNRF